MGPTSIGLQVATVAAALLVAVAAAWMWDRGAGWPNRRRWPARVAALTLCPLLALGAAAVAVNRELDSYLTWGQLFGLRDAPPPRPPAAAGTPNRAGQPAPAAEDGPSQLVQITITGRRSGIELPAWVYLPAGYDSATGRHTRFPVVEALAGFPGSPKTWLDGIGAGRILDEEIANRRMAPTVVVFPVQDAAPTRDSECVDAVGGAKFDTYLSADLQDAIAAQFRVRSDGAGWGLIGYSTGGFCVANLALRHPDRYTATASLSGYFSPITDATTGNLYRGDVRARNENDPLWRLRRLPVPAMSVYLACAQDDQPAMRQIRAFLAAATPPLRVTTGVVPQGGHTKAVWSALAQAVFDWLSQQLAAPAKDL